MTDNQKPIRPPHLWKPGQSGNIKGRPKSKHTLSEAIRAGIDPAEMVTIALGILRSPTIPASVKIQMWQVLSDRGWSKPPAQRELTVSVAATPTLPAGWAALSVPERLAYLETIRTNGLAMLDAAAEDDDADPDGYGTHIDELQVIDINPDNETPPKDADHDDHETST